MPWRCGSEGDRFEGGGGILVRAASLFFCFPGGGGVDFVKGHEQASHVFCWLDRPGISKWNEPPYEQEPAIRFGFP